VRCAAVVVPVALAVGAGLAVLGSSGPGHEPPEPVEVASTAPHFGTLDELVAASDTIVLAEVVATADGRTVTAAGDTGSGFRTQLTELGVVLTLVGDPASLVVEEEAALLDGTPMRVDGVAPAEEGQRGVFFLVQGGSDADRVHAVVGPQGRVLVGDRGLEAAVVGDPLGDAIVDLGGPALIRRIAELSEPAT
jgi:hypothetical protein